MSRSLKLIACLKFARGTLALIISVGLWYVASNYTSLSIGSLQENALVRSDPFLQIISSWFQLVSADVTLAIATGALLIAMLRYLEGVLIWQRKRIGHWLAIATGSIYIPLEIYLLLNGFRWAMAIVLVINILVVLYLLFNLRANRLQQA
jgi:uncharacterized membrane protein (DUF2068 family)